MAGPADEVNGNGSARTREAMAYLVTGLTLAIGLGALGHQAVSTVDTNRSSGDAALHDSIEANVGRIVALETSRVEDAYRRGVSDQTLRQLEDLTEANAKRIEAAFEELDTKVQREFALADDTLRAELNALDSRLQNEIAGSRAERHVQLEEMRARLVVLEAWMRQTAENRWSKADQERFEAQLGLSLKP